MLGFSDEAVRKWRLGERRATPYTEISTASPQQHSFPVYRNKMYTCTHAQSLAVLSVTHPLVLPHRVNNNTYVLCLTALCALTLNNVASRYQ